MILLVLFPIFFECVSAEEPMITPGTYNHHLACNDFYTLTCGGILKQNPFVLEKAKVANITHLNVDHLLPTRIADTLRIADKCQYNRSACYSATITPVKQLLTVVQRICEVLNNTDDSCTRSMTVNVEQLLRLDIQYPRSVPIITSAEGKIAPVVMGHLDDNWDTNINDKNRLFFKLNQANSVREMTKFMKAADISQYESSLRSIVSLQRDLGQIRFESHELTFTKHQKFNVCESADKVWPEWINAACELRNGSLTMNNKKFAYSFESLIDRYKLANNVKYRQQLETTYGQQFIKNQTGYADQVANNIVRAFQRQLLRNNRRFTSETLLVAFEKINTITIQNGIPQQYNNFDFDPRDKNASTGFIGDTMCEQLPLTVAYNRVNAWAEAECHMITMYPSFILPPKLDEKRSITKDSAIDYAAYGFVLGHELAHHFDTQNLEFLDVDTKDGDEIDKQDWQTVTDASRCIQDDMTEHCCLGEGGGRVCTDSKLTQGEDLSDSMGLQLALDAYMKFAMPKDIETGIARGDLSADTARTTLLQKFFYGYVASFCWGWKNQQSNFENVQNVHSPQACRNNVALRNNRVFGEVFACDARTDRLARPDSERCKVWK